MSKVWFRPVFVCPKCEAVSYNPNDIREQYCGRCHKFVGQAETQHVIWDAPNPNVPKGNGTLSRKGVDSLP
jgi:hypothetical protein